MPGTSGEDQVPLQVKGNEKEKNTYDNPTYEDSVETDVDKKNAGNDKSNERNDGMNSNIKIAESGSHTYESVPSNGDIAVDNGNKKADDDQVKTSEGDDTTAQNAGPTKKGSIEKATYNDVMDDDVEFDEDFQGRCWKSIYRVTGKLQTAYDDNRSFFNILVACILLLGYAAYLVYACIYDLQEALEVLIVTGITVFVYMYIFVRDTMGERINEKVIEPGNRLWDKIWNYIEWPFYLAIIAGLAVGLYFLTRHNPENLVSFVGLVLFVVFCYVFSNNPPKVKWRPVLWGLVLQFLLGLFILRTYAGFVIFEWLSDVVFVFLNFASAGSEFLYGEGYQEHYFAFTVLPIIIYFSSVISILYYWGVIQAVIQKVAWLMQRTMKTSASESLNAAANIFVGMTEAPLLIKPYLKDMTRSEIHAIMTGGFATVAGSTLGAYILAGIDATHLIAASVMSAPAALAISKLFYPETEKSKHMTEDDVKLEKGEERNFVEAAANGASNAIPLVLNIAANLIAFLSLLALVNALLGYFGGLVGYPQLTFELICSYVFMPVAFIMGVEWADCNVVAELIGLKTFVNEFYAYDVLAQYIKNRETGDGRTLSERSEVIATYALCGFANIGSIGIMLGGLTPMAPTRKKDLAAVAIRALIAGTVACFLTACIAGILYVPGEVSATNSTAIPQGTTLY